MVRGVKAFRNHHLRSLPVVAAFIVVACGASEKRSSDNRPTPPAPVACPPLDIPAQGTEQTYRDYLRSLRSQTLCAEPWQATLLKHVEGISIKKDEASTGASFVELGSKIGRCSIEARQCFVSVKLKRDLLGFAYVSATLKDERVDNPGSLDLVRNGAISPDARFMKNCPPGEACELPVDLLDLLRAPKGTVSVVAAKRPLADEIAAQKAEEARLEEERIKTCEVECFARAKARPKPKGQPPLAESFQKKLDEIERKKCHTECTQPSGVSAPK